MPGDGGRRSGAAISSSFGRFPDWGVMFICHAVLGRILCKPVRCGTGTCDCESDGIDDHEGVAYQISEELGCNDSVFANFRCLYSVYAMETLGGV